MSTAAPIFNDPSHLASALRDDGYAVLRPQDVAALAGCTLPELRALEPSWDDLALDNYLKDGGRYRRRRHSCFVQDGGALAQTPHRAHWQPVEYNALHGGMHRLFEPVEPAIAAQAAWRQLIVALGGRLLAGQGRAALVHRGAPVPHRYHRRHRPPHAGRRAPRRRRFRRRAADRPRSRSRAARRASSKPMVPTASALP